MGGERGTAVFGTQHSRMLRESPRFFHLSQQLAGAHVAHSTSTKTDTAGRRGGGGERGSPHDRASAMRRRLCRPAAPR